MASEVKNGVGCAVILIAVLIVPLIAFSAFGRIVNDAANERAAAIRAQAELEVATAIGRQMDAATAAVIADTAAAHSVADAMAQTVLTVALGVALLATIVALVAVLYNVQSRRIAELTAKVAELGGEVAESGGVDTGPNGEGYGG